jgi:hypothetical protein
VARREPPVALDIRVRGLTELVRAIRREEDGEELKRELAENLADAMKPAAAMARGAIMSMASAGMGESPGLRSAIAAKILPEIKLGGTWTGARVRAYKTYGTRRFPNAPKRTQNPRGWRTQTYGNGTWRTQRGKPYWFDRAMQGRTDEYKKACARAVEAMARRIASRA